ncbi:hypothetical protein BDZ89DRAFT_1059567 [Hymenopellis radicata]|nr:hypothetical protein BDZ89DRAFT_1059567 [Hymenopellis radicata]
MLEVRRMARADGPKSIAFMSIIDITAVRRRRRHLAQLARSPAIVGASRTIMPSWRP